MSPTPSEVTGNKYPGHEDTIQAVFGDTLPDGLKNVILPKADWHRNVDNAVAEARPGTEDVSVVILDFNNFKDVNDLLGHPKGDLVAEDFQEIFAEIAQEFRLGEKGNRPAEDVMSIGRRRDITPADIEDAVEPGRIGGDEFAFLCRTDEKGTEAIIERVREKVKEYVNREGNERLKELGFGIAIGAATLEEGMTASELLGKADGAMYKDKKAQRPELSPEQQQLVDEYEEKLLEVGLAMDSLSKYRRRGDPKAEDARLF